MVKDTLARTLSEARAFRWKREKTPTGTRSTGEYADVAGTFEITDVRFSDANDKIRVSVLYTEPASSRNLGAELTRDEFGLYTGILYLPDGFQVDLEVQEPSTK